MSLLASTPQSDPAIALQRLRRRVRIGVYGVIAAFMSIDALVFGQPLAGLIVKNVLAAGVATITIEVSFAHHGKLRHKLWESESGHRALLQAIPDAMFRIDRGGTILDMAASAEFQPPVGAEQVIGGNAYEQLPAAVASEAKKRIQEALATEELQTLEYDIEIAGETRSREARIVVCGPDSVLAIVRDVSERKRSEEQLRALSGAFEMSADGIVLTDVQGRIIEVNKATVQMFGSDDKSELRGRSAFDLIVPDERPAAFEAMKEVAIAGHLSGREYTVVVKDGRLVRVELSVGVIHDPHGLATGFVGISRDITQRKEVEEALRQREEYFRSLIENASDVITVLDPSGSIRYNSPAMEKVLGYDPMELVGKSAFELVHPEDLSDVGARLADLVANPPGPRSAEFRFRHKDGRWRYLESVGTVHDDGDGHVEVVVNSRDVTDRRETQERYRLLFERNLAGVYRTTTAGRVLDCNEALARIMGYESPAELVANAAVSYYADPKDRERFMARLRQRGAVSNFEVQLRRKDGQVIWVLENATLLGRAQDSESIIEGTIIDITESKRAEETIKHLAFHDSLTGLPNRVLFRDRLKQAVSRAARTGEVLAVMFLDLDGFKVVNDSVGHVEGDRLLRQVSRQLSGLVREADTVARVGGDEFTVLLPDAAPADVEAIGQRIVRCLARPRKLGNQEFIISGSIGITFYPQDATDADTLLRNADIAMYRAKEQGRNGYRLYNAAMKTFIAERLTLETSLRHALERDELVLHYQPQVQVASMKVVGFEALLRWQTPDGLRQPDEFIGLAEDTGLLVPIGEWVLNEACAEARRLEGAGAASMRMAVNLSRQFQQPNIVEGILAALDRRSLDPTRLEIEITEGVAMHDAAFTIRVLEKLRDAGVSVAIDDFGTGYSSLSYLKRFPIDALKIDRSFVRDLQRDDKDSAIAASIIGMAHRLGLRVVAEGVETPEQLAFLKDSGCDEFQGFLFARPVSATLLRRFLSKHRLGTPSVAAIV